MTASFDKKGDPCRDSSNGKVILNEEDLTKVDRMNLSLFEVKPIDLFDKVKNGNVNSIRNLKKIRPVSS